MHDGSLGLFQFDRIDLEPIKPAVEPEAPPHYHGHRDRLRLRAPGAGPPPCPTMSFWSCISTARSRART